jgi:hypothetical protein
MSTEAAPSRTRAPSAVSRQALQLALRVLDLAEVHAKPHDMCQATLQVARCLKVMADYGSAESYLGKALGWSALVPCVDARVELLCELSEVAVCHAEALADEEHHAQHAALERARDHVFEAAQLAAQTTDAHWEVKVLLRVSDTLNRCGDHDDAAWLQDRAIALLGLQPASERPHGEPLADALRSVGPTQLM